jgi:hypothetical protein
MLHDHLLSKEGNTALWHLARDAYARGVGGGGVNITHSTFDSSSIHERVRDISQRARAYRVALTS